MERRRANICGVYADTFTFEDAVRYAEGISGQVVTLNPEMINNAVKNSDFRQIVNEAELVIPDGIGVKIGLKILGESVDRIAGVEFARHLIEKFAYNGKSVAFLGAKSEILQKTIQNIELQIPDINIVFAHDGYYDDEEEIINGLKSAKPDLLLVALGSPKQEEFIYKMKTELPQTLMIGVGGSFDVWSGVIKRAPVIYRKLGLEWLYRTVKEPKRFKRIFPALPLFILRVFNEKLFGDKNVRTK